MTFFVCVLTRRNVQHYFPCPSLAEACAIAAKAASHGWRGRVWIEGWVSATRGGRSSSELVLS